MENEASTMSFVEKVRRQFISAPAHKSFSLKKWEDGYASSKFDSQCDALFQSGIIINILLSSLRTEFNKTARWSDRATHIRYLIGTANRDDMILSQKIHNDLAPNNEQFLINQFQEYKVNLAFGENTPDEVSQSIVESLSKAISALIKTEIVTQIQSDDQEKLNSISLEMGICGLYHWVEAIWEDCLWNGYEFLKKGDNKYIILPTSKPNLDSAVILCATQYRRDIFIIHNTTILSSIWHRELTPASKSKLMPIKLVSQIFKEGKRKRFALSSSGENIFKDVALSGFVAKDMVNLEYYKELLEENPKELKGNSVNQLVNTWLVLRSVSSATSLRFTGRDISSPTTLLNYAPTYNIKDIIRLVSNCLDVELNSANDLINFLIFTGKSKQTLYSQPLIDLGNGTLTFSSSALHHSNPIYVLERWLSQLSVDISKKGSPFERHIRGALLHAKKSVFISNQFQILNNSLKFTPGVKGERSEEIDLIFILGSTVFIGEIKCTIAPTEPIDYYNNREIVIGATKQAKRKTHCVEKNLSYFRKTLMKHGITISDTFSVKPIVILNNIINSGFPIDDVPVVDLLIIERYFEGFLVDRASSNVNGEFTNEYVINFYDTPESAAENFVNYLKSPPQLRHIHPNVKFRSVNVPVNAIDQSLPELHYISFEAKVTLEKVLEMQNNEMLENHEVSLK